MSISKKAVYHELGKDGAGHVGNKKMPAPAKNNAKKTGLKGMGAELESLNEKLAGLTRISKDLYFLPTPVFTIDRDFNVTYINKKAFDMIGFPQEYCMGKKCYDLFKTSICRTKGCPCMSAMEQNKSVEAETTIGQVNALCKAAPIKDATKEIVGAMETIFDITSQKKSEAEMLATRHQAEESASFNESLLRSIREAHFAIDLNGIVVYANEASERLTERAKNDIVGKKILDVIYLEKNRGVSARVLQSGEEVIGLEDVLTINGKHVPASISMTLVRDSTKKITGLSITVRDITVQHRALTQIINVANEAGKGNLDARISLDNMGELTPIAKAFNSTMDTVVDKTLWYEAIIDAVPFPIHVTDADMKWTYMNKPFEKLMIDNGRVKDR
ncbi:MAG TPA: PAS domain-containing protein, partial [Methanocella sp.]|nr:PAS domain-containing protein [Methanocella sp.]